MTDGVVEADCGTGGNARPLLPRSVSFSDVRAWNEDVELLVRLMAGWTGGLLDTRPPETPAAAPPQAEARPESGPAQVDTILKRFRSRTVPAMDLRAYSLRIHRHMRISQQHVLVVVALLWQLRTYLTALTVHRLVLASFVVADKVIRDVGEGASPASRHLRWAQVGGVLGGELARLEMGLLFLVDFEVSVSKARMQQAYDMLLEYSISPQA